MDPNAHVDELLSLARRIKALAQHPERDADPDDVARLCASVEALDAWLANEGRVPARWARKQRPVGR